MWYPNLELKAPNTKEFLFLLINSLSRLSNPIVSFINSSHICYSTAISVCYSYLLHTTPSSPVKEHSILFSILKKKKQIK